ncbi:MAG: MBL fold metallo-hydrolase [Patescibacteria group bacterium]
MRRSVQIKGIVILILFAVTLCIGYVLAKGERRGLLTISFLDVGQGDSIFIDTPSGRQVLIDGGPNSGVLRKLARVSPWYDRSIDVIIPTHPDADHIGGLIDVLDRYKVSTIVRSSVEGDTKTSQVLIDAIRQEGAQQITAKRGQIIDLGKGVYLEILFPDRNVAHIETNTGCIVARLVFGDTAFMLSCDAPQNIENYLVSLGGAALRSNVLKAGHHGSKTSSALAFIGSVDPQFAVYSRGCKNKYGHPAPETTARFEQFNIPILDTCNEGTITFVSDGRTAWRR